MNWLDILSDIGKSTKDKSSPMYEQIMRRIDDAIVSGQLPDGTKMPTNRELAGMLNVDRSTVARAYLELQLAGLIESHVGRGTFVKSGGRTLPPVKPVSYTANFSLPIAWSEKFARSKDASYSLFSRLPMQPLPKDAIAFTNSIPNQELYPWKEFQKILSGFNSQERLSELFAFSAPDGYPPLIAEIQKLLKKQGIDVGSDEILIVNGSKQGIDIVTSTLVDPNDAIIAEEPTYHLALCDFKSSQARCMPLPIDDSGLRVDMLESMLVNQRAKLLYVTPSFQNPTGTTISLEKRRQLLQVAERYQLPVLEDNVVGDLYYGKPGPPPLRALAGPNSLVIHQGTISKTLFPGFRIGWLLAPKELMGRLRSTKRMRDVTTNTMSQVLLAEYLKCGLYDKHLEEVRQLYGRRKDAMLAALDKHLHGEVTWTRPDGGMSLWLRLPTGCSSRDLLTYAEREGTAFIPGDVFFFAGDRQEYLRLSFVQIDERKIEEGIQRLAKAIRLYLKARLATRNSKDLLLRDPALT